MTIALHAAMVVCPYQSLLSPLKSESGLNCSICAAWCKFGYDPTRIAKLFSKNKVEKSLLCPRSSLYCTALEAPPKALHSLTALPVCVLSPLELLACGDQNGTSLPRRAEKDGWTSAEDERECFSLLHSVFPTLMLNETRF